DAVLALEKMAGVEGPVEVDGMMAPVVEADALAAGCGVGEQDRAAPIMPETIELLVAGQHAFGCSIRWRDAAMHHRGREVTQMPGERLEVPDEGRPDDDLLTGLRRFGD